FITLGGQHASGLGLSELLTAMAERQEQGYIELQRVEWAPGADIPTRSHHQFSGVPWHHRMGTEYDAARLGTRFVEALDEAKVVCPEPWVADRQPRRASAGPGRSPFGAGGQARRVSAGRAAFGGPPRISPSPPGRGSRRGPPRRTRS